jgi:hypothetical protein
MTPMTRPMVVRSLASLTNEQPIPAVKVAKHPESPEVAIMTLTQSAFSHDTAKLMIKVRRTFVAYRNGEASKPTVGRATQVFFFSGRNDGANLTDYSLILNLFFLYLLHRNGGQWSRISQSVQWY